MPTAIVTHIESFHVSKAIATLDYVCTGGGADPGLGTPRRGSSFRAPPAASPVGRRGRRPRCTAAHRRIAGRGRRLRRSRTQTLGQLGDDAEIRDVTTGRFIDRNKLHYIDFAGRWFSVKGPSITPRPPQGQPIVAALSHGFLVVSTHRRRRLRHAAHRRAGGRHRRRDQHSALRATSGPGPRLRGSAGIPRRLCRSRASSS